MSCTFLEKYIIINGKVNQFMRAPLDRCRHGRSLGLALFLLSGPDDKARLNLALGRFAILICHVTLKVSGCGSIRVIDKEPHQEICRNSFGL